MASTLINLSSTYATSKSKILKLHFINTKAENVQSKYTSPNDKE